MVPYRVLQTAQLRLALAAALLLLTWLSPGSVRAEEESGYDGPTQSAAIVDLRPGDESFRRPSRLAFREALEGLPGIELSTEADLLALLSRDDTALVLHQGRELLGSAIVSFGALDCSTASTRAKDASAVLAAAKALGADADDDLRQALLYRFICADRAGDAYAAMDAAGMLRALQGDVRPKGISDATWAKYPLLDAASNQRTQVVELSSSAPGASFWIDFRPVSEFTDDNGKVLLSEGEHLFVASGPKGAAGRYIEVGEDSSFAIDMPPKQTHWKGIELLMKELGSAKGLQREDAMRDLMAALRLRIAYVMREPGKVSVWVLPENSRSAELAGAAPNARTATLLAHRHIDEQRARAAASNTLLRERDIPVKKKKASKAWIYAMAIGAALVTGAVIVGSSPNEARQRIEVTLP